MANSNPFFQSASMKYPPLRAELPYYALFFHGVYNNS
jgi:hypothetical protein